MAVRVLEFVEKVGWAYLVTLLIVLLCIFHFRCVWFQMESEKYPSIKGTITECDGEHDPRPRSLYVAYEYQVNNVFYRGSQQSYVLRLFGEGSGESGKRMASWGKGKRVDVFYNPKDPSDALLDKGMSSEDWATCGGVGLLSVVAVVVLAFLCYEASFDIALTKYRNQLAERPTMLSEVEFSVAEISETESLEAETLQAEDREDLQLPEEDACLQAES